jgi:hypothetical protein
MLVRPALEKTDISLQVTLARLRSADLPPVESHAGDAEDLGDLFLRQSIGLAQARAYLR